MSVRSPRAGERVEKLVDAESFQEIGAFLLGYLAGRAVVPFFLGRPDAPVIAQGLRHKRQLGLMIAADGDAGGMNLSVARVGEGRAFFVGAPGGGDVAPFGIGGKIKNVAVTAGGQNHRVGGVGRDFAGDKRTGDDALGMAVDEHQV